MVIKEVFALAYTLAFIMYQGLSFSAELCYTKYINEKNFKGEITAMSKSARLKKIKEERMKNDEIFRKKEEARKNAPSKAMKKFIRKESFWVKLVKFIMVLPFLYSGFFYGGITVISIFKKTIDINTYVGTIILISLIAMLVALILAFKRFYISSFAVSLVSVLVYFFITKKYFVDYATGKVTESGNINPQYKYMIWFYPILLFLLCSFILLIIAVFRLVKKKRKERAKIDNAPTKSIVD